LRRLCFDPAKAALKSLYDLIGINEAPRGTWRNRLHIALKRTLRRYPPLEIASSALFTCGIGDFIAIDSFLPPETRRNLRTIFYATRAESGIRSIIEAHPDYQSVERHVTAWSNFDEVFCFHKKCELESKLADPGILAGVHDFSIVVIFDLIDFGRLKYCGCNLLTRSLTRVSASLPREYFVICPYSPNDRRFPRDFTQQDWQDTLGILESRGCHGVVLNVGDDHVPRHPLLVDLSNKTSLLESIEILKSAIGYIGIDSSLSVVAAKLFGPENLRIKSRNPHCYRFAHFYFAPHTDFPFLNPSLTETDRRMREMRTASKSA
jgi:hypothetical protein